MASILLPQPRLPQKVALRLLDFGTDLMPPAGGSAQRVNKLGNRWQVAITLPRLRPEPDGRVMMAALNAAKTLGALFPVPQPGLTIGAPGAPVVNGGGQTGAILALRGLAPGYLVRAGQKFSIIHGGQRYLHEAQQDMAASGAGTLALAITPMLRISPGDGEVAEFAQPIIEGFLSGDMSEVELSIARAQPATITITERA